MANILTNLGRAILSNRLSGGGTEPKQIGWGTGGGTSSIMDTALFSEKAADLTSSTGTRAVGTSSQQTTAVTNDTYQVTGTLTATGPGSVTNIGLFDNSSIGSGNLFLKGDFSAIALNAGDSIAFTFKLQFS
jgi:hypothetical protein